MLKRGKDADKLKLVIARLLMKSRWQNVIVITPWWAVIGGDENATWSQIGC